MAATGRGTADALRGGSAPPGVPSLPEVALRAPPPSAPLPRGSLAARLFREPYTFDFFQAVRILERLDPARAPVGGGSPPATEAVRLNSLVALNFPASAIHDLLPARGDVPPLLTVTFFGLAGVSGVLPRHYSELLLRVERESKSAEKTALRDWLDLFNHRLLSLFYRAWEKYRFDIAYERHSAGRDPDPFTRVLFSLVGVGERPLRGRLRVASLEERDGRRQERVLARVEDLTLAYYAGLLAHRPRCAVGLEALLQTYFGLPVRVQQFQGQWLQLDPANQSRLGDAGGNSELGVNLVAGQRVWDVQGKIRLRVGPLRFAAFQEFLPDRTPVPARKRFFELVHLARFYVGPELDFDVQVVLAADDVPECRLAEGTADGPQLGWDTWLRSQSFGRPVADAVFEGQEVVWVNRDLA